MVYYRDKVVELLASADANRDEVKSAQERLSALQTWLGGDGEDVSALFTAERYLSHIAQASRLRRSGHISAALAKEARAEKLYAAMPHWMMW